MSKNRSAPRASRLPDPSPAPEPVLTPIALQWTPDYVDRLVRSLSSVLDPRIRTLAMAERLAALTEDDLISVAGRLHDIAGDGHEAALQLLACFRDARAIEEKLGRDRMLMAAAQARLRGDVIASELLRPIDESARTEYRTHKDLRELTLGERKALARSGRKDLLAKLLHDDHPHVMRIVLANPRVGVAEVVAVSARRPGRAHQLRGIALHARWMHNYAVGRALAKNPDTPLDVAGRYVANLTRVDLEEIADDGLLHPTLRRLASRRLELRVRETVILDEDNAYELSPEELRELGLDEDE